MQQWEYRIVTSAHKVGRDHLADWSDWQQAMNRYGAEGWEVVGVVPQGGITHLVYLKRPK